jgi:hypothetical protein
MSPARKNPQTYIRMLAADVQLTEKWRKDAESDEEKEELDREYMFFHKLLDAARKLTKQHGEWRH